jgi:hypothetical protein
LETSRLKQGMESCEQIHRSVLLRYNCEDSGEFRPYPYRPKNAARVLEQYDPKDIADFTEFENLYRPWNAEPLRTDPDDRH